MRRLIGVLCFMLLATCLIPMNNEAKADVVFSDIGNTHRAHVEIYYLAGKSIVNGVSDTHFAPDRNVTRGEAVAMLGRALQVDGTQRDTGFSDIPKSYPFSGYISELVESGIVSGFNGGTFQPNRTLTRGEMALFISRAFDFDASSMDAATKSLMENGIALGLGNGTFGEHLNIKRADFSVFLARSINTHFRVEDAGVEEFKQKLYVNAGKSTLNMRTGPSVDYPVITKLTNGTEVKRAKTVGAWSHIKVGNTVGYVHSNYLESTYTPPTTNPGKKPLKDVVVIIDPGHGGRDSGAVGHGFQEKNITLNIGRKVAAYYDNTPIQVKMTRTGDTYPTLQDRVNFARQNKGDIFVSIHANSFNGQAHGQETYYYRSAAKNPNVSQSKALATYVQSRMLEAWNLADRGVKPGNFHVLRENTMPAVLAEVAFIDNANDMKIMGTEAGREKMAKAIFLATLDYYYHYEGRSEVASLYTQVNAKPSAKLH